MFRWFIIFIVLFILYEITSIPDRKTKKKYSDKYCSNSIEYNQVAFGGTTVFLK